MPAFLVQSGVDDVCVCGLVLNVLERTITADLAKRAKKALSVSTSSQESA